MAKPATKSKPATSVAPAKPKSTAVATLSDRLKSLAEDASGRVNDSSALMLRLKKNKTFELPDGNQSQEGQPLKVIIVEHSTGRGWFDRPYKEGEKSPPACAAGSLSGKDLAPYEDSPKKQAKTCEECAFNQWGSAPQGGDGKACKEHRKLALLPYNNMTAPFMLLQIPPTSLKAFDGYVKNLAKLYQRPPVAYITEIAFDTTVDYQKLTFGNPKNLDGDQLEAVLDRVDEAREMLTKPPSFENYEAPAKGAKGRGGRV